MGALVGRAGLPVGIGMLLVSAAGLSGCAVGPAYAPPQAEALSVPAHYSEAGDETRSEDLSRWWMRFDDRLMVDLIAAGTPANLDVAVSLAQLASAREGVVQARSAIGPTATATAGETHTAQYARAATVAGIPQAGGSTAFDSLSPAISVSWQADLFGGNHLALAGAKANAEAARFRLEAVRASVAGDIATHYIAARLAQAQIAIARETLQDQDANLRIATWRAQAGLASALDVEQARAQRAQTAATIPMFETAYAQAVHRLGVLSGLAPGALRARLDPAGPIPRCPDTIAVGIPADTLRQRPDVLAAERDLANASAQIGVTRAQLFPALTLTGTLSSAGSRPAGLFDLVTSTLFAGLSQTLFDHGRQRSAVRAARANADAALATYRKTVLTGLEDVENAMQALAAANLRLREFATASRAAEAAAALAREQYRSGLIDFVTLLQSEQTVLTARQSGASAEADKADAVVQLYLALGGGWHTGDHWNDGQSR